MKAVLLVPGPRQDRLAAATAGVTPRDFFYGFLGLGRSGYDLAFADTRADPPGLLASVLLQGDIARNRLFRVGYSRRRYDAVAPVLAGADVAISPTDGFSLSLGLSAPADLRCRLIGGFMGLSDLTERARPGFRGMVRRRLARALHRLDHVFFFSPADRAQALATYALAGSKTSLLEFGVDTEFWCPGLPDPALPSPEIFAIGSDPSRDYETLFAARPPARITLVTRLPVSPPPGVDVNFLRGDFYSSALDDVGIRNLYRAAKIVVVPVRDVWQPSGQSVTMQAMACGRPVVLTRNRGLWAPGLLRDGENCLLVPPADPAALRAAICRLLEDPALAARLGSAARATAAAFNIDTVEQSLTRIVQRALQEPAATAASRTGAIQHAG